MGFTIIDPYEKRWRVSPSLDGHYLLPYSWLKYGLENNLLEIEDRAFYDTLQGSLYLELLDKQIPTEWEGEHHVYDVWYEIIPGKGEAYPVVTDLCDPNGYSILTGSYVKQPVHFCNLVELWQKSLADQKTINNSIVQLMKGCRLKLKCSVWSD
jgi:hypothetical protein